MDERESEQDLITEVPGTDVSDKKKAGKFQPFRKLFGKRRRKGTSQALEDGKLNPSQWTENICNGTFSSDEETNDDLRVPNNNMGTRAFSHDSIFMPDGPAEDEQAVQTMSQDNILGKVKTLQQQLVKNIKFGQPPTTFSGRRMQDTEEDTCDGGSPTDPMEVLNQLDWALSDNDDKSSDSPDAVSPSSLLGAGPEEEAKVTPVKSSRSKRPITGSSTIQSINLDAVPRAVARLDNSAAKHKLSVKPKNQRRSKKHKLEKNQQNVFVAAGEHEGAAKRQHKEQNQDKHGHTALDKHTIHVEIHAQSASAEGKTEHQRCLEKERLKEEEGQYEEVRLQLIEEEKRLRLEEQLREEERKRQEELNRQELEARRRQEEQRQRELEESRRLEMAAHQHLEKERKRLEDQKKKELEEHRRLEEQRQHELEEQKRLEMAAQRRLEEERKRQEEQKQKELEARRRLEEQRQHELEEKKRQEEERKRQEELRQRQLEERKRQEEQRQRELEEQKRQEEERKRQEELKQKELAEHRRKEEWRQRELEEQKRLETEEQQRQDLEKKRQEEQRLHQMEQQKQQELEEQNHLIKQQQAEDALQHEKEVLHFGRAERLPSDKECNLLHEEKQHTSKQPMSEQATESQRRHVKAQEQQRIGEELKWQEVDQRQTMPRPYTFQVLSGEKQIIFQKVNLSPVTPSKEPPHSSDMKEPKTQDPSKGSHALPSSMCVPHTAILVTGAQLCGTAVNMNQIKDTACKSLLGLTEERKTMDYPPQEHTPKIREHDTKPSNSKTKFTSDTLDNQAMLAEWASIRSRILKGSENGKATEKDQKSLSRCSDDWTSKGKGDSHGNLRKTMSASAKFSITPAWQKFAETAKTNTSEEYASPIKQTEEEKEADNAVKCDSLTKDEADSTSPACVESMHKKGTSVKEKHGKKADTAEGCKFAKDLPSFLVPSPPQSPSKGLSQPDTPAASEGPLTGATRKSEKAGPNGEEKTSPFGIKLRRTNYSLRFHCDQQGEQKRKKRYSAGDSFDGVPAPLLKTESEKETHNASLKQFSSPNKEKWDATTSVLKDSSDITVPPLLPPINSHMSSFGNDKQVPKSLIPQKPSLSPKPTSPTPPSSPLVKTIRSHSLTKVESDAKGRREDFNVGAVLPPLQNEKNEEEETKEKKSFFPSINIPWREKPDKKPELSRKDKPVLQSRHSIDCSRLPEKVETAQPMWITLALQKQKGFREQQATREERKQAREAKQAEKLAKENVGVSNPSDCKSSNVTRTSTPQKSSVQEDEKKTETSLTRLQRREQLKKSNTLPTSVTVEISDSIPSAPLVKDISKRFSTPDATPMSTEPAWLALAKRKAKAWSDCPQIIK